MVGEGALEGAYTGDRTVRTGVQDVTLPGVSGEKEGEHSGRDPDPDYVIRRSIQLLEMALSGDLIRATGEQTGHVY